MKYIYIDGDDIGLKIENSFLDNDEDKLIKVNADVKEVIVEITEYLVSEHFEIIFSGADGIICKGKSIDCKLLLTFMRNIKNGFTFSLGISNSLRGSYIALRYAKSKNKNIAVEYENDSFSIIK